MFDFGFFDRSRVFTLDSIIEIIGRIKRGDSALRDRFIHENKPFIKKSIRKVSNKFIDIESSEEFSVGLCAFNEAIESFDIKRQCNFYKYSNLIIHNRIIDYYRSTKNSKKVIPFSSFEENETFEQRYLRSDSHYQYEKIEIKEDIMRLQQNLSQFGVSWNDLIEHSPKHKDSRCLCIRIANEIIKDKELFDRFTRTKRIPQSELIKRLKVHRRTIENHRIYIIAVCLILTSNKYELKEFIIDFEERGEQK